MQLAPRQLVFYYSTYVPRAHYQELQASRTTAGTCPSVPPYSAWQSTRRRGQSLLEVTTRARKTKHFLQPLVQNTDGIYRLITMYRTLCWTGFLLLLDSHTSNCIVFMLIPASSHKKTTISTVKLLQAARIISQLTATIRKRFDWRGSQEHDMSL